MKQKASKMYSQHHLSSMPVGPKTKGNSSVYKETGFVIIRNGPLSRKSPHCCHQENTAEGSEAAGAIALGLFISLYLNAVSLSYMCSACQAQC